MEERDVNVQVFEMAGFPRWLHNEAELRDCSHGWRARYRRVIVPASFDI